MNLTLQKENDGLNLLVSPICLESLSSADVPLESEIVETGGIGSESVVLLTKAMSDMRIWLAVPQRLLH